MNSEEKILNLLNKKAVTKQEVYRNTKDVLRVIQDLLKSKAKFLNDAMKDLDKSVLVEYLSKGNYEAQIKFSGDTLLFHMHSNVFDFPKNHSINQTKYVKDDNLRSFCGVIHIYNILSDSLKYNRLNDEGYLIARIFINKDNQFFVEGEKQLGFLFNDFVNQKVSNEKVAEIIDVAMLFALDFDMYTPNFNDVRVISVYQILEMSNNQKIKTAKRLGYKFSNENK